MRWNQREIACPNADSISRFHIVIWYRMVKRLLSALPPKDYKYQETSELEKNSNFVIKSSQTQKGATLDYTNMNKKNKETDRKEQEKRRGEQTVGDGGVWPSTYFADGVKIDGCSPEIERRCKLHHSTNLRTGQSKTLGDGGLGRWAVALGLMEER
ncbi:hypothetical protein H5410_033059 [Solanum commersonii]|uniref:Uncharacterized protein n=1 Tax=Solanum commersonii TaxID=4109 RepID=A0A9J5YMQ1_SOLCO|nr:hypothetical protein H5410_033059 [Solanum commersonii]